MSDPGLQTGFYFSVIIDGSSGDALDAAFKEVSGLSNELGVEEVVSGGENRFKYRLPNVGSSQNLVLKRGVMLSSSPLIKWVKSTLEGGLAEAIQTKNLTVNLYNAKGAVAMSWSVSNAYPLKWATSDLKSQDGEVLIETIELAYQYFTVNNRG